MHRRADFAVEPTEPHWITRSAVVLTRARCAARIFGIGVPVAGFSYAAGDFACLGVVGRYGLPRDALFQTLWDQAQRLQVVESGDFQAMRHSRPFAVAGFDYH
ncbi:hypothetical protein [Mycobacteroides abscessus]|uniref:hypothetical protein n=1 Tax=Mycobacteroides abscessus TaxID=36809 RepID=UPI001390488D